jgi:hypothetical protein
MTNFSDSRDMNNSISQSVCAIMEQEFEKLPYNFQCKIWFTDSMEMHMNITVHYILQTEPWYPNLGQG